MTYDLEDIQFRNENQNSAQNFNSVIIGNVELYFSYSTIVAFRTPFTGLVVSENVWSNTTGKHLNWLCDKDDRVPRQEFLDKLRSIKLDINLVVSK